MQKNYRILRSILIIGIIVLSGSLAFAEQTIKFKDGTVIKGEIQNETLTVETSFGKLTPPVEKVVFVSEGSVELKDGSKIAGNLIIDENGLIIKTKYGTWTLHFTSEDLEMIMFQDE